MMCLTLLTIYLPATQITLASSSRIRLGRPKPCDNDSSITQPMPLPCALSGLSKPIMRVLIILLIILLPLPLRADSLLLDFGPVLTEEADSRLSPAHMIEEIDYSIWNTLEGDSSNLVFANGDAAPSVSIDVGLSVAGISSIDFSREAISGELGVDINTGVYARSSPIKDGIYGELGDGAVVGLQIRGLPAGAYKVFIHGRNTNSTHDTPMRFFLKVAPPSEIVSFSNDDIYALVDNSVPANKHDFVEGDNFAVLSAVVREGQSLFLAAEGTGIETRGFFNIVEIIPETGK